MGGKEKRNELIKRKRPIARSGCETQIKAKRLFFALNEACSQAGAYGRAATQQRGS